MLSLQTVNTGGSHVNVHHKRTPVHPDFGDVELEVVVNVGYDHGLYRSAVFFYFDKSIYI